MKTVSLIVISFNNSKYIYEAIDSILNQDYEQIELIVSDDGSDSFDLNSVKEYILNNKGSGIVSVAYNINDENIGTCSHIKKIASLCTGDVIGIIAADDALYGTSTISKIVKKFNEDDENDVVCCNLAMCDHELNKIEGLFVSDDDIDMINNDVQRLFEELSWRCVLPALGTYYSKKAFEYIIESDLLSKYELVEDWTSHILLAREGFRFSFLNFTGGKHRFGGGIAQYE